MKNYRSLILLAMCSIFIAEDNILGAKPPPDISGERKKCHKVTVTFNGPQTSEDAEPNPFLDYRLNVTFAKGKKRYIVPGHYAADGNAAETSATTGNKWRVHFVPDEVGHWIYTVSFHTGPDIALSNDPTDGSATSFDGDRLNFRVDPSDKTGRDHRAKGLLKYVGERCLWFAETDEYFLKGGADSPVVVHTFPKKIAEVYEQLLGYEYFDGPSLQTNDTHAQTVKWIDRSATTGRQWFVSMDEIGPAHTGVKPDEDDYWHDEVRHKHLWGHLMAGGAGVIAGHDSVAIDHPPADSNKDWVALTARQ